MQNVFLLEPTTTVQSDASYIASYPHLVEYFSDKAKISPGDVVRAAHMAYGWMPTILDLYPASNKLDLASASMLLTKARDKGFLQPAEISALAGLVNNSLVGASKLLHFVAPNSFAIWDSKVYSFVHEKPPYHHRVNAVDAYVAYLELLAQLAARQEFGNFHASIQQKIGYAVSPFRALELVMYLNAPAMRANNSFKPKPLRGSA